jgi:hypothetical protein
MKPIIELFHIPNELTVEFLGTFARFEYALKRAGYVLGDEKRVSADWDRLGRELALLDTATLAPVIGCCHYLQSHPPMKQVLEHGQLLWKTRVPAGSQIEDILLSVRTVRNNVFHGGKFPDGPIAEPLRDELLIRDCLTVLNALLSCPKMPREIVEYFQPEV